VGAPSFGESRPEPRSASPMPERFIGREDRRNSRGKKEIEKLIIAGLCSETSHPLSPMEMEEERFLKSPESLISMIMKQLHRLEGSQIKEESMESFFRISVIKRAKSSSSELSKKSIDKPVRKY